MSFGGRILGTTPPWEIIVI